MEGTINWARNLSRYFFLSEGKVQNQIREVFVWEVLIHKDPSQKEPITKGPITKGPIKKVPPITKEPLLEKDPSQKEKAGWVFDLTWCILRSSSGRTGGRSTGCPAPSGRWGRSRGCGRPARHSTDCFLTFKIPSVTNWPVHGFRGNCSQTCKTMVYIRYVPGSVADPGCLSRILIFTQRYAT